MIDNTKKSERTKNKLKNVLIELCSEKEYQNVTIGDICEHAGTYRSTFYRYYDTKDDMLREIENEYIESSRNLTLSFMEFKKNLSSEDIETLKNELTEDMKFHQEHRKLCMFLLSPYGDPYFTRKMSQSLSKTAEKYLKNNGTSYSKDTKYILNFFANGYISTIYEWLLKEDRSAEQIADFLLQIILLLRA